MIVSNTKDIFYLVLSLCVIWFTVFLCWLMYYFIAIMRDTRGMVSDARQKLNHVETALKNIAEKVTKSVGMFAVMADGLKYAFKFMGDRKAKSNKKKQKGE